MSKLFIPADILEKMVCTDCTHYLSVFPIYTKNDSSGAVCGRCTLTDGNKYIRDEAYETISQYLLFPCMHNTNGCQENLTPMKLGEHEQSCRFRKFDCPSLDFSECPWQGPRHEMVAHFEQAHADLLLKEGSFDLRFNTSQEENLLLWKDDRLFLVKKDVEARRQIFTCSVHHLRTEEEDQKFKYYLQMVGCDKTYFYSTEEKSAEREEPTRLEADFLKEKLNDPQYYIVKVEVFPDNRAERPVTEVAKISDPNNSKKIDWEQISNLKCLICATYMLPPVYQCPNGHSFCSPCSVTDNHCPLCKQNVERTQNFTLEGIVKLMIYPCKFRSQGCDYACNALSITEHEHVCEHKPYNCPMAASSGCDWNSSANTTIYEHIENNHLEYVLKTEKVDLPFSRNERNEKIYFIKFSKLVFKFVYQYDNEKFRWEIQHVTPSAAKNVFRFEIDLIDLSGNKRRCYMTGIVSPPAEENFVDPVRYVVMTLEQAQSYILDIISFRIRLIKG